MTTRQVSCGTGTLPYKRESRSLQNVSAAALAAAFRCSRHGALSIHSITLVSVMRSVVRCCSRSPLIQSISHSFAFSISTQSFMLPLVRCKMNMRTAGVAMVERPLNRRTFVRAAGVTAFTFADAAAAFTQHGAGCGCDNCATHGASCSCAECSATPDSLTRDSQTHDVLTHEAGCACAACSQQAPHDSGCPCPECE